MFGSYFGGLRDAILHPDWLITNFDNAKQLGFDGIRVFPNWWWELDGTCTSVDHYPLIKGDGSINFDPLSGVPAIPASWLYQPPGGYSNSVAGRLQFLLDVAWEKGLVVELAFAGETWATGGVRLWDPNNVTGSTLKYRNALKAVADALETAQFYGDNTVSPTIPPQTGIATSSSTCGVATPYHIVGYPDYQYLGWRQLPIAGVGVPVGGVDTFPVFFSEPERHRFVPTRPNVQCNQNAYYPSSDCANNYETDEFISAVREAKLRGAAAWTFHNEKLFRLGSNYAPGMAQVEDQFLQRVGPEVGPLTWPRQ